MINDYLTQIINLDSQISKEYQSINNEISEIKNDTIKEISHLEATILDNTRAECQNSYEVHVRTAEKEKEKMIAEAQKERDQLLENYNKNKDEVAKEVIDFILSI